MTCWRHRRPSRGAAGNAAVEATLITAPRPLPTIPGRKMPVRSTTASTLSRTIPTIRSRGAGREVALMTEAGVCSPGSRTVQPRVSRS